MSRLARDVVETYCKALNDKDLEALLELFEEDAELIHPFGTFKGREKLREFYGGILMQADVRVALGQCAIEGDLAIAEISTQTGEKPQHACDVFNLNGQGQVSRLAIYYRHVIIE